MPLAWPSYVVEITSIGAIQRALGGSTITHSSCGGGRVTKEKAMIQREQQFDRPGSFLPGQTMRQTS